ncbi:uncharacterized protein LOC112892792 [Panicum hallii]|jgi:hypothetical protein|uniref:uncharacterized protein LOC112892792 n=1 Tax=Panicum hallii TaxID=206008 RepID=UPI000DF4E924|nr:uncharacterized protein LOC112892792 [Panicum hallii]
MATPPPKPTGTTPPPKGTPGDAKGKKTPGRRSSSRKPSKSRSPPRRRGSRHHDADKTRERVVERVVRDSGSSGTWPQLTKTNYTEWSLRMKVKLQARDLWDVIEYGDGGYRDDRSALDAICSAVPAEMIPMLAVKETAMEAWEAIKTLRIGDERRRGLAAQTLRKEYENTKLRDGEAIEDFALRFSGVLQRLGDLGDPEPEEKAVKKYLRVVRPRYKHLVVSMEAFADLSKLSVEEITGTLKSSDDADEEATPASNSSMGKLLLTQEEWLERYKPNADAGRGGSGSGGRGKSRGRGRGRGRGGGSSRDTGNTSAPRAGPDDICKRCGKKGHWAQHC